MKKIVIILLVFCSFITLSCSFSKGVRKDLKTGLTASYNGFALEDIYLTDAGETRLDNNTIALGTKLYIMATGVENFEEKNGRVFPGCHIVLTDKNKSEILNLPDAFAESKDGTPATEATTLKAMLTTGDPMVAGETYHLYVRFFDKNKKENEIVANVDLLMK
jgi:predicted small secreted protein